MLRSVNTKPEKIDRIAWSDESAIQKDSIRQQAWNPPDMNLIKNFMPTLDPSFTIDIQIQQPYVDLLAIFIDCLGSD
jgi:hypothetical protein